VERRKAASGGQGVFEIWFSTLRGGKILKLARAGPTVLWITRRLGLTVFSLAFFKLRFPA
jgi:hypothetical protein